ncbi:hypothetical protein FRC02_005099 [Tulasnella sp. 418]|nr:hypothetical protein FRC02_005099 [Tulasnella sp. 418]
MYLHNPSDEGRISAMTQPIIKVVAQEALASTLADLHICLAAFGRTTHLVTTGEVDSTRRWTCSSLSSPLRYDGSAVHSCIVFFAIISNLHTQKPFQSVVDGFATSAIPTTTNVTKVIGITANVGEVHRLRQYQSRWLPNMTSCLPWSNQQDRVQATTLDDPQDKVLAFSGLMDCHGNSHWHVVNR